MIAFLLATTLASQPMATQVGYQPLVAGQNEMAITVIGDGAIRSDDPAALINLGIAHARNGDRQTAKAMFTRAFYAREWVELETATGDWVDSRTLARQALAMLDEGRFARASQFASK